MIFVKIYALLCTKKGPQPLGTSYLFFYITVFYYFGVCSALACERAREQARTWHYLPVPTRTCGVAWARAFAPGRAPKPQKPLVDGAQKKRGQLSPSVQM